MKYFAYECFLDQLSIKGKFTVVKPSLRVVILVKEEVVKLFFGYYKKFIADKITPKYRGQAHCVVFGLSQTYVLLTLILGVIKPFLSFVIRNYSLIFIEKINLQLVFP